MVLFAKHKKVPLLGERIQKSLANRTFLPIIMTLFKYSHKS